MNDKKPIDLSIILPCHNEGSVLIASMREIRDLLDPSGIDYEIIIMEDGSSDGTDRVGRELAANSARVRFYHADERLGRGRAVARGIGWSHGRVSGFIDVDLQTPARYIVECYRQIEAGADAVETIRVYDEKASLSFLVRKVFTVGYQIVFKLLFRTPLKDTLAGCKFFDTRKILPVLERVRDNHWFWDTEVMVLAHHAGLKIVEIPSQFRKLDFDDRKSKTNLISTTFDYLYKLAELKLRLMRNKTITSES